MPDPVEIKYRAFISYSHVDQDTAKWLHSSIERFRIEKDLAGRITATGKIPDNLRPVCRDRDEFTAGRTIAETTHDAIAASAALIVLCSPAAVSSHYVNTEINLFRSRYPDRPIIPVIVSGEPGDPQRECLPDALRYKADAEDSRGDAADGLLAADLRKNRDSKDLALAKIIARLLGLNTDDVYRRVERARKRSERIRLAIAAGVAFLILAAAASGLFAWNRAQMAKQEAANARREQGLKLVAAAYEVLYRDPPAAVLRAYSASTFLEDTTEWRPALDEAYKVAILRHLNRLETSQITGNGPSYLAGRWKQGNVFTKPSPDGRQQLVVTERGVDGPTPPGDVYLVNNESMRTTKLASCFEDIVRRVEDVSFDRDSRNVFVTRQYDLNVYSLAGQCIGKFNTSCCTKSPVHMVEGYLADHLVLAAESKGGLWLVDPMGGTRPMATLQPEFKGDAALAATVSSDRRSAAVVFESGRAALVSVTADNKAGMKDFVKEHALFAGFLPGRSDRLVTTSNDGWIRQWQIATDGISEIADRSLQIKGVSIDWVAFSEDNKETMLAVGDDRLLYVIDQHSQRVLYKVGEGQQIDWATARSVAMQPVVAQSRPASAPASISLPSTSQKVAQSIQAGGRTWLVVEQEATAGLPRSRIYLADGDHAVTYAELDVAGIPSIEQFGELLWIKPGAGGSGPLLRTGDKYLDVYVNDVVEIVPYRDTLFVGTHHGLYSITGSDFKRIMSDTTDVQDLRLFGGQLWIATKQGAYVLERDRLVRVTEAFVDVRAIKSVGGRVWLLTHVDKMFEPAGPAYLVEDYFAYPLPDLHGRVTDVRERDGQIVLVGAGTSIFDPDKLGPSYEVDPKTRQTKQIAAQ